jgi:hypothetical protein
LADAILTPTREPSLLSSQVQQGPGHPPLNSPVSLSDPLGLYVTVKQYTGRFPNPLGHIGIAVNGVATLGFYGDDSAAMMIGDPVPGTLMPDAGHVLEETTFINTTPEQDQAIIDFITRRIMNPADYTLGGRNCANFVSQALAAAGLGTNNSVYPRVLFRDIRNRYGDVVKW